MVLVQNLAGELRVEGEAERSEELGRLRQIIHGLTKVCMPMVSSLLEAVADRLSAETHPSGEVWRSPAGDAFVVEATLRAVA